MKAAAVRVRYRRAAGRVRRALLELAHAGNDDLVEIPGPTKWRPVAEFYANGRLVMALRELQLRLERKARERLSKAVAGAGDNSNLKRAVGDDRRKGKRDERCPGTPTLVRVGGTASGASRHGIARRPA